MRKLVIAVVLRGVATFMFVRFLRQGDGLSEETFFYDLSENSQDKLITSIAELLN